MRGLIAALRFLTRIPCPGPCTTTRDLAAAVGWFPLVGSLIGACIAAVFSLGCLAWTPMISAILATAFGLLLTGGFHEDGFTDAMDGLGGGTSLERVIEIMKDSRIGAYGSMGLWVILSLRAAFLVALDDRALAMFPLAMTWGRWSISVVLRLLPPISQGLAKEVHSHSSWGPFAMSSVLTLVISVALSQMTWILPVNLLARAALVSIGVALVWTLYLKRRLGGHSGDLLGAGNQLVEAAVLMALLWT